MSGILIPGELMLVDAGGAFLTGKQDLILHVGDQ